MRFAQSILASAAPLETLANGTADFPLVASTLADVEVTQALFEEVSMNQGTQRAAMAPSFTINGLSQPLGPALDPFLLLRVMREERQTIEDVVNLNDQITGQAARELLITGGQGGESQGGIESMLGELFDARDKAEGGGLVTWWNNFEKDGRYNPWPKSVRDVSAGLYCRLAAFVPELTSCLSLVPAPELRWPDVARRQELVQPRPRPRPEQARPAPVHGRLRPAVHRTQHPDQVWGRSGRGGRRSRG